MWLNKNSSPVACNIATDTDALDNAYQARAKYVPIINFRHYLQESETPLLFIHLEKSYEK